jgi:hypothetical protein
MRGLTCASRVACSTCSFPVACRRLLAIAFAATRGHARCTGAGLSRKGDVDGPFGATPDKQFMSLISIRPKGATHVWQLPRLSSPPLLPPSTTVSVSTRVVSVGAKTLVIMTGRPDTVRVRRGWVGPKMLVVTRRVRVTTPPVNVLAGRVSVERISRVETIVSSSTRVDPGRVIVLRSTIVVGIRMMDVRVVPGWVKIVTSSTVVVL